jgi:hypothetical protein
MGFLAIALPFLKTWWKVIVPIVLLLLALGYVKVLHMEIDHYKTQVIELKLAEAATREKNTLLEHAATELSKKYARQLENQLLEKQKQAKLTQERIKRDEESKRIALSSSIVSLFNDSKPDGGPVAETVRSDVGGTSAAEKTLNQLLQVSAENDTNHTNCIATVKEWQNFWADYQRSVNAIGGSP